MESVGSFAGKVKEIAVSGLKAFLGPEHLLCAYCGTVPRYSGLNPLGVCRTCFEAIPWVREIVCPICGRYEACPDCTRRVDRPLLLNRSAVQYDERMKELLALYKYRGDEKLKLLLGRMLVQAYRLFPEGIRFDVMTYVPLSRDRYAERGFNQAEQTARVLSAQVKVPVAPLLVRMRHTDKQSFKSRQERLQDLKGVFTVDSDRAARLKRHFGSGKIRIVIVDDVYTTGSTLNQCAAAIREALPQSEVYGLCWAR